jgi:3' terminal RNA ribose 2'-O-methyltransferase Hen1
MLLEISTTHQPATDLGYLLGKNPARAQAFTLPFGIAHVFYPQATPQRCTAALLLEIDPVGLVRGRNQSEGLLDQYVNDRPYVASSFLSVALARVFREALNGKSRDRQELADSAIPLEARINVLPCKGGESFLRRLFEPLGYALEVVGFPLDPQFPQWGQSRYFTVTLRATLPLSRLLSHLYVLIPVLDNQKHYFVDTEEMEKLLKAGDEWLPQHPERQEIVERYLKHRNKLAKEALGRLLTPEELAVELATERVLEPESPLEGDVLEPQEAKTSLNSQRLQAVLAELRASGASTVLDLGCGEGNLLRLLVQQTQFSKIVGMDVSSKALEISARRLKFVSERPFNPLELIQGSLTYFDSRLLGFDAAALVEVIEHLEPDRLNALERSIFGAAQPKTLVVTTPNQEYNSVWESLPAQNMRHRDHRFEWTRAEFEAWAQQMAQSYGYSVVFKTIGEVDLERGSATQMAVFSIIPTSTTAQRPT